MTGINIIGMPFGLHGLGLELRDKALAMKRAGIDVCILNENYSTLARQIRDPLIEELVVDRPVHGVNLFCHNLPAIGLIKEKKPEIFEGRHNIAAPYWEFLQLPPKHARSLDYLDELWVSTDFLRTCFAPHTDVPVHKLPLHMSAEKSPGKRFGALGRKREKALVFGYVFDFNSMAARKDPMILLTAFLECFADRPKADVKLVIKFKTEASPLVRQRDVDDLVALAARDPRIELIDTPLSAQEMNALYDSFDVYVSPHRAEGLGRGICEMMLKGKAVAATGYSGPAEFLTDTCAVTFDYYTSHVGAAASGDIKSYFTWADVKIESVMEAFERFAGDPELAPACARTRSAFWRTGTARQRMAPPACNGSQRSRMADRRGKSGATAPRDSSLMSGARQFAARLGDIRSDHRSRYAFGLSHLAPPPGSGLDLFCGNGYGSYMIARQGYHVMGIDASREAIDLADRTCSTERTCFSRKLWPFCLPEAWFDFCFCLESIEHVADGEALMDQIHAALRPGGLVVLSTPNEDLMPFDPDQHRFHTQHYTCAETLNLFHRRDMQVIARGGQMVYDLKAPGGQKLLEGPADVVRDVQGQFTIAVARKPRAPGA